MTVGITEAGIALPLRRVQGKLLREAGRAAGYEALRVPWWDEDPLTLAIDAGLTLGDAVERARRIVVVLDEAHEQATLARHALDVDLPVTVQSGPLAAIDVLDQTGGTPTLLLTGGHGLGAAGVAALLEPGEGVPIASCVSHPLAPLGGDPGQGIEQVLAELPGEGPLRVPAGVPGRGAVAGGTQTPRTKRIGDVGVAGPLLELVDALSGGGPVRTVGVGPDRVAGLVTGERTPGIRSTPDRAVDVSLEAVDRLDDAQAPPWSEASQGAYVSREDYDADLRKRYGARAFGEATVAAVTTIEAGPPGEFARQHDAAGPYDVAIVETDAGGRRIVQSAAPPGKLAIGDRVRGVLRRLFSMEEQWRYAVKVLRA